MNNESHNRDFITFLRTIFMILENHNFHNTLEIFKKECVRLGYDEIFISNNTIEKETKPASKIIFESLSKHNPCRIVIENDNDGYIVKQDANNSKHNTYNNTSMKPNENYMSSDVEDIFEPAEKSKNSTPATVICGEIDNHVEHVNLKKKFSILQKEHQKLMDVVTELTFALQTSIKGELDDTRTILDNCEKMYPELFCKSKKSFQTQTNFNQDFSTSTQINEIKEGNNSNEHKVSVKGNSVTDLKTTMNVDKNYGQYFNLDYKRIKYDLKHGDLNAKILLLQALRWRITKTPLTLRDAITRIYVRYDILNVHNCSNKVNAAYPKNSIVFTSFYCTCNSPKILQQAVTRFINALASVKTGRDYIEHQSVILSILLSVLLGTHPSTPTIDGIARDMIIATLQKMSLRYSPRMIMICDGLTEHLIKFLTENLDGISEYSLEYSIALLRNLWLHNESREKCYPFADDILNLLKSLLDEQYMFCLPYITGCFYNLLPDDFYNKSAKNMHLDDSLLQRIQTLDGDMKEQLQYILDIYLNPDNWHPLCECDLTADAENEMDIIEPEIDQNEIIIVSTLNGEQLLSKYSKTHSFDDTVVNLSYMSNMFSIPVTPNICNISLTKYNNNEEISNNEPVMDNVEEHVPELKKIDLTNNSEEPNETKSQSTDEILKSKEIEMTFCEDTQQLCYVPSKNGIFESDETYTMLHSFSPSFLKNIGEYNMKNISKSLPVSARNRMVHSASSIARSANNLSPTYGGTCYRDGFKPKSYSSSNTPHIGFCDETNPNNYNSNNHSKYSCDCFAEMKRSIDEDPKKNTVNKNNNEKLHKISIKNELSSNISSTKYCKYKCYPTSNSAPLPSSIKIDKSTDGKKRLDETDYTSVFVSRPRILRTP